MDLNNITNIINMELGGLYGHTKIKEMSEIINYYNVYDKGQDWYVEEKDYTPTKKKTNYIKKLIKEESRFLFGKTPTFAITTDNESNEAQCELIQKYLNDTLKQNLFSSKLIKGARDCFIGKRIAIKLHADSVNKQIRIMFVPSLEFVYEPFEDRVDELKKIIFSHEITENPGETDKNKQVFWKQKYEMVETRDNQGKIISTKCIHWEAFVNGYGKVIEVLVDNEDLGLSGIPCYVVLNDGLSGDLDGESDVAEIMENQLAYNRLASEDIDTLIKGMNRTIYAIDVEDTSKFKLGPGAFWDVKKSMTADESSKPQIGIVETDFNYNERMQNKLSELKTDMHEVLNIPLINNQDLKGMMTSGKSMKALYWQLITRCEEKMQDWRPALEWMVKAILEMTEVYNIASIPKLDNIVINVENQYPLQEDEDNEKVLDMQQVNAQVMSRKTYIEKWNVGPSDEELKQIQLEKSILEDTLSMYDSSNIDE